MSEWKEVKIEDILLVPSRNGLTKPSAIRGKGAKMIAMGELFAQSPEVNKCVGGAYSSNHLTGCAVDIRCVGVEQAIRYATILLDTADEWKQDFDELLIERNRHGRYWVHFAVRPKDNRRRTMFLNEK